MTIETVNPAGSEFLLENFHFSQAAWHAGVLHCSGQIGMNAEGRVPEDAAEEFRNAWQAVGRVLEAAGLGYSDIVEYTTFHVGLSAHMNTFMGVRDEFLAAPWPAWTAIGITELAVPGARLEIQVTAAKR
jgi:enamine deaminase RidA (YjgF/YER057c/UK114 family)